MAAFLITAKSYSMYAVVFSSVQDTKMETFFKNDFSVERWRLAALKNAFSLLGLQRFHHAAAFFLLGNSVRDAIEVREDALKIVRCSKRVHEQFNDIVIMRLYFVLSIL